MDSHTVRQKHKDFLFPCVANYYAEPVVITEAHGSSVKDLDGREYLDFFGGILTAGIGHSHPDFVRRIQDQVARLVHTSSVYPTVEQVRVAEKLTQITPGKLKKSFFTTSGTEADETAIMLAKIYTGQQEIIALRHSYAGRSQGAIAITGQQPWRVLPTQIPGVKHALSPYCYGCHDRHGRSRECVYGSLALDIRGQSHLDGRGRRDAGSHAAREHATAVRGARCAVA